MLGGGRGGRDAIAMNDVRTVIAGRDDDGIDKVRVLLEGLAAANRLPRGPVIDMQVALDEILSNTLRHGFDDGLPHRIEVTLSLDSRLLAARIEDDCAAFDPLAAAANDPKRSPRDPSVGGLGLYFVRSLMSEVTYTRVDGRNRLVLKKRIADAVKGR